MKILETCVLKYMNLIYLMLTDVDMLLMVEKGIRGGICHAIYRYAKANNKQMKNYNKYKEESFIQYRCKQFIWLGNVSKITCKWF